MEHLKQQAIEQEKQAIEMAKIKEEQDRVMRLKLEE